MGAMTGFAQRRDLVYLACCFALLPLLIGSCSSNEVTVRLPSFEYAPPDPSANAAGQPGPDVTVYDLSNEQYFEAHPDGTVTVRAPYDKTIAITCDVGWGRSCLLGVGIPTGAACFCKSVWGAIPGHGALADELIDSRFASGVPNRERRL
jgi:hypothetical protein